VGDSLFFLLFLLLVILVVSVIRIVILILLYLLILGAVPPQLRAQGIRRQRPERP
jgi:hypothetical protein